MARIRTVKPDFFLDFELAKLDPHYQLFFIGLWTHADKSGRGKNEPDVLKVKIQPWSKKTGQECLSALCPKWVCLYTGPDKRQYFQVRRWEHQRPHHTEPESTIPPPTEDQLKNGCDTVSKPSFNGEVTSRKGRERKGECSSGFTVFWEAYPKKKSKAQAEKAWCKLNPSEELVQDMLKSIETAKTSRDWTKDGGQFVPYPATWLNSRRWEDEEQVSTGGDDGIPVG